MNDGMSTAKRRLATFATSLTLIVATMPWLPVSPTIAATSVFINEIHYDNTGTDTGESIEVAGPAGTDLSSYQLVLYNGSGGAPYATTALSGVLSDQQDGYGTAAFSYPSNGIQNGSPDGIALVGPGATVVQFLSYEGVFPAVGGPADGITSTDIGVSESGSDPVGESLQLTGIGSSYEDFAWASPQVATFGAPNTGQTFGSSAPKVWVNEIHYDNAGTDVGEFVEIALDEGTDLTGWSIVRYNGNGGTAYASPALADEQDLGGLPVTGTTAGFSFVVLNYPSNGLQNGSPDGLALVNASDEVVQFLSYEGTFAATDGPAAGMTSTDIGAAETGSDPIGGSLQLTGVGDRYVDFSWALTASNTAGAVNTGQAFTGGGNLPVLADCGSTLTIPEGSAATQGVSAADPDGTVVSIAIDSVEPASSDITIGSTTPAAGVGGTATAQISVASTAAVGSYDVTVVAENDDSNPQQGSCTFTITVAPVLTIGEVQGSVGDTDIGATHASPYVGQNVYVRGVVTERGRFPTSSGGSNFGFWLQSAVGADDGDQNSSDGIFAFIGGFTTVLRDGGGPTYFPVVGDEIVLRANVSEYFNLTELSSLRLVEVLGTGIDVTDPTQIVTTEAQPPDDLGDANRYWERHEGMRFHLDAGAQVVAARDVFTSTADAEVWVIRGDHPIAQRTDPYERLVYRDAHPLDDQPGTFDNGNGMRIMLQSHGLKWNAIDPSLLIAPARTYDTVDNALTGALYYAFGKYGIEVEQQLQLSSGVDPAQDAPPSAAVDGVEFSTSDYNVENLYDYRDDPNDGCDFTGNSGCPGVNPPFDYVPASEEAYRQHLDDLAAQIVGPMHAPDILMIQEAEDQDICWVDGETLACGTADNADGKPDTLQDLALAISAMGGPTYDTAYDRNGADDRGIVSAFMFRTDNVELLPADASDPVLGSSPTIQYAGEALAYDSDVQNPKALNARLPDGVALGDGCDEVPDGRCVYTRDPQVGHFRVWRDGIGSSVFTELYAISNHFSSTPDARVEQRTEQAAYNAAIAQAILAADPEARIVSAGDFNVYPRPDDPFPSPNESDQLGPMYDAGLQNLWDVLVSEVPQSAYSYSYQGQAQTLDMQWADANQFADLVQIRAAHINADFAADYDGDVARGASDHDPQLARWNTDVTFDRLHALVDYYVATGDLAADDAFHFHDRLDRAAGYLARGKVAAAKAQLMAFGNQAYDFVPAGVAEAVEKEGDRLASQL
jgi:predicted extracellular nuclease